MKNSKNNRGHTLVEIIVVLGVSMVVMAGVMSFYIMNLRGIHASEQRMKTVMQVKKFTNEMILQGSRSNRFILYKSITPADFDGSPATGLTVDSQTINSALLHPAGDFVVFVYYEIPKPASQPVHRVTKIEGYYLNATAGSTGSLRKIIIDLTSAPSTSSVEAILTNQWDTTTSNWKVASTNRVSTFFPLVRGLIRPEAINGTAATGTPSPRLFYISDARNVIISGQVYSSAKDVLTNNQNTYSNSFNFTITPRT